MRHTIHRLALICALLVTLGPAAPSLLAQAAPGKAPAKAPAAPAAKAPAAPAAKAAAAAGMSFGTLCETMVAMALRRQG